VLVGDEDHGGGPPPVPLQPTEKVEPVSTVEPRVEAMARRRRLGEDVVLELLALGRSELFGLLDAAERDGAQDKGEAKQVAAHGLLGYLRDFFRAFFCILRRAFFLFFTSIFFLTLDGARMRGEDAAPPAPPPRILQELTPAQGEHLVQVIEDAMDLDEPALPYYPPPSPDLGTRPPRKRPREEEGSEGEEEEPDHLLIDLVSSSPPATPPEPPPKRARPVERIDDYLDRVFPKPWFANVRTPSTPHGDEKHRPVW